MQKNDNLQILVDGDPFAYRAAFSCADEETQAAVEKIDELLETALELSLIHI